MVMCLPWFMLCSKVTTACSCFSSSVTYFFASSESKHCRPTGALRGGGEKRGAQIVEAKKKESQGWRHMHKDHQETIGLERKVQETGDTDTNKPTTHAKWHKTQNKHARSTTASHTPTKETRCCP